MISSYHTLCGTLKSQIWHAGHVAVKPSVLKNNNYIPFIRVVVLPVVVVVVVVVQVVIWDCDLGDIHIW